MPMTSLHPIWRDRVFRLAASPERMRSRRIWQKLSAVFGDDCPSERWIEGRLKEWDRLPPEVRQNFYSFRWPDSMLSGALPSGDALPWEAGKAALELLRLLSGIGRPPILLVKWWWRVSVAVPDAPPVVRLSVAQQLASQETVHGQDFLSNASCEMLLVHKPWESDKAQGRYRAACRAAGVEPFRHPTVDLPPDADLDTIVEAMAMQMGHYGKGLKGLLKELQTQERMVIKSVEQSIPPTLYEPEKKEDKNEARQ